MEENTIYLTKVGYKSWGGNEFCKVSMLSAKSEQEALDNLIDIVKSSNYCKEIVWGTCAKTESDLNYTN